MSVALKVSGRIERMKRGEPFTITGFYALGSHAAVQKAFSRLTHEGVVVRVDKGIYVRPKPIPSMPSIKTTASAEKVARVWAKEHGYKLVRQGLEAAYRLGLQTQAPMTTILWSNGPSREFKIGNDVVKVKHIAETKLRWENEPEGDLLRGLLVTPPESIDTALLKKAFGRLSLSTSEALQVVRKLNHSPLLQSWQRNLKELEQSLNAQSGFL